MFYKLRLKGRIFWGYSIPILLAVSVSGLVYVNSRYVAKQITTVESAYETEKI